MDYLTRYYINLCEDLQKKLNLLEYVLPGVNPSGTSSPRKTRLTGLLDFPQTRLLAKSEKLGKREKIPDPGLKLFLKAIGYQQPKKKFAPSITSNVISQTVQSMPDLIARSGTEGAERVAEITRQLKPWSTLPTSVMRSLDLQRTPETLRASDEYDQLRPPDSLAISEIEPSQNWSPLKYPPQDETLKEPRWRSTAKRIDNYKQNVERIKSEEQERERRYQERRQRFQPPPTPNLASLAGMSPTERSTAIAGMRSRDLEQIQKDRYNSAKINTMMGRAAPMGADNLEALGAISSELEDRRGPLGGSRNVEDAYRKLRQSVPESDIAVDLSQFNKVDDRVESELKRERDDVRGFANERLASATGKLPVFNELSQDEPRGGGAVVLKRDELKAMEDRVRKDMEKDFASSGKMSPQTYNTYAAISLAKDAEAEKRAREHADWMASREEAAKKMYGDQWMNYM